MFWKLWDERKSSHSCLPGKSNDEQNFRLLKVNCKTQLLVLLSVFVMTVGFPQQQQVKTNEEQQILKLFLAGDVMLGRGIDQALPYSVKPVLYEAYVKDARDYVKLAERENGKLHLPLSYNYLWGDALEVWKKEAPDFKLVNLETAVTTNEVPWSGKGIHYRMHPKNIKALTEAKIDHVSLSNNHVLDWSRPGLLETMQTLKASEIDFSGAGKNAETAAAPSILTAENGRILVYSYGSPSSGVPAAWAAGPDKPGVNFLPQLDEKEVKKISRRIAKEEKPGDLVVFSIHWGANWGYSISEEKRKFAHQLIDAAGVDVVFGHSSHHPLGIEVYHDKLIIYGAGDFFNDYEGISGKEKYRGELSLMYFPQFAMKSGDLTALKLIPMEIKKFRLNYAEDEDVDWMQTVLNREGQQFGTRFEAVDGQALEIEW